MKCARGLFFTLTLWAVQWLFDLYMWGAQEVSQTLISNLIPSDSHFKISASWVIEQGTCDISYTVKRRSHYDSQSKVILFGAVWHASFMHHILYASVLSPKYAGWYLWGRCVFPTIKQHMKQHAFISITHACNRTHSFFCFIVAADKTVAASCQGERMLMLKL